ncbi:hypothetical protein ABFA07_015471 [Porites harrisoni]
MPQYKLTYFPIRGKAECIRIVFAIAGVEFEDVRVHPQDWPKLKESGLSPSGQLPILEVNGQILTQSKAILSYVAKELGLAPEDNFQLAQADMLAGVISELEDKLNAAFANEDQEKKEKALTAVRELLVSRCEYFEKLLATNNKRGFFFGEKLTYADVVVFAFLNSHLLKGKAEGIPELLKDFLALSAWYELVRTQPKILEWLKNPPADIIDYVY